MKHMITILICSLIVGTIHAAEAKTYDIVTGGGKKSIKVTQADPSNWSCIVNDQKMEVSLKKSKMTIKESGAETVAGKRKGENLTLTDKDGKAKFTFKISSDKIKLQIADKKAVWEFKVKPDKVKVRIGEKEYGKIKFYNENGKIKVKNSNAETLVEAKGFQGLKAALGAFLIEGVEEEDQAIIMLILLTLDK